MRATTSSAVVALALFGAPSLVSASGDAYEWGGSFDVSDYDTVYWVAQKVDGDYVDPTMNIYMGSASSDSEKALKDAEEIAEPLLEADSCTSWTGSSTMTPSTTTCFNLVFDTTEFETTYEIDTAGVDYLAIFAEHVPTEFERTTHYLVSSDGDDIEPVHELPEDDEDKPYGIVFATTLMVNLCTLAGVAFFGCKIKPSEVSPGLLAFLYGSAAGALLACAFFLILPEALHMIGEDYEEEVDSTWRWGTSVLAGIITPVVFFLFDVHKIAAMIMGSKEAPEKPAAPADAETEMVASGGAAALDSDVVKEDDVYLSNKRNTTLLAICGGDFFHNLTDGFAIGIAFKVADCHEMAWGLVGATIYHEVAQEVSDYIMLTSDEVGLSIFQALFWNFISGTSVIIGGLIATGIDPSNGALGIILAYGGGTYVYLACSEVIPWAMALYKKMDLGEDAVGAAKQLYLQIMMGFTFGSIVIGLILLGHEHCAPGGHHAH